MPRRKLRPIAGLILSNVARHPTLPERLKLSAGTKVRVTVDAKERVILTPARHEPAELFANRPPVKRVVSVEEMDRAIAKAVRGRV